ncbi:MAG TPA: hypothetical protein PLX22_09335, partial [Spirochaetota bacterium]|nr:hypothetical protein [Spirochaetota bacterium]HQG42959.1 hypothetical protein [Spirochaetota bacterium]HRR61584.1 hypothetical protein [Spirochaetota bacterium]
TVTIAHKNYNGVRACITFVGRQKLYPFVRGYLCAKYPLTNPVEPPQTAVCLIPLYGLYLCHRAAEDILSLSSHEPYGATASMPSLFFHFYSVGITFCNRTFTIHFKIS